MLTIDPTTLAAFHAAADRREVTAFAGWWRDHALSIGPIDPAGAAAGMAAARAAAPQWGLDTHPADEPGRERLFLLAAALRLMPAMRGDQLLLAFDAIYARAPAGEAVAALRAIAAERPR